MGAVAFVIVPWTIYLALSLPSKHVTPHWSIAWGGFDVALAASAAFTAWSLGRAVEWVPVAASITGTLLVCDAWFDLLTARAGSELFEAVLEAAFAEIPLAIVCFWLARRSHVPRRATSPPRTPE
jgi:hypothetical protein